MNETPATTDPAAHWWPFVDGVRAFVARRVPAQDVDDVVQEVMVRLHRGADSLRQAERAESWVYGVTRRAVADYYRGRSVGGERLIEEALPDKEAPRKGFGTFPGEHSVHEEVLSWLRPMAEELPQRYREALLLADFEGHTQQEVADTLGLSLSGAKSRVQRARVMLGEHLRCCCEIELGADGKVIDFHRERDG